MPQKKWKGYVFRAGRDNNRAELARLNSIPASEAGERVWTVGGSQRSATELETSDVPRYRTVLIAARQAVAEEYMNSIHGRSDGYNTQAALGRVFAYLSPDSDIATRLVANGSPAYLVQGRDETLVRDAVNEAEEEFMELHNLPSFAVATD